MINTSIFQIEITYRFAFTRSSNVAFFCDENAIKNRTLLAGGENIQCQSGCAGIITKNYLYCTDFSETEDWTIGVMNFKYTLPVSNTKKFQFGLTGCCWLPLNEAGAEAGYILRARVDLTNRSDTGRINSSPISAMQPVFRLNQGCDYIIKIPVADDDGDTVRCRWARNTTYDECSDVCKTFTGSYLDEVECVLKYNATGLTGWYAVSLQIEDFLSPMDIIPLSSVPLQFLVVVTNSSENCTSKPVFPPNIITDGSVHHILVNNIFNVSIYARSGTETLWVTTINTVSPFGMIKSELYQHDTIGREWFVVVTWIPTLSQTGSHVFCFTAVDNIGQLSDQVCGTIVVHAGATLPSTTITSTTNLPKPDDPLTTKIPNGEVIKGLITGLTVGGLALFGVTAFVLARCLCCCKSAKVCASSKKPERSKMNTNVNADNFYCLDYKGEFVSATPAKSHAFSNVVYCMEKNR
ncbi:unnamed protein product [Mytilus edulis]|uniref:Uncharacterized protein n=1 Tax=Mytilus edulis TaxID=6550 RepID=A0A8S3RIL3_MYTED|nr:unnamed protein product [Mytilus edulis]